MRSGGRLWMVTLRDREPEPWDEELPGYFRTRRSAEAWAEDMNAAITSGERGPEPVAVLHAPDDVRASDIDWDDE